MATAIVPPINQATPQIEALQTAAQIRLSVDVKVQKEIARITQIKNDRLKELENPLNANGDLQAKTTFGIPQACLQSLKILCGPRDKKELLRDAITKASDVKEAIIHRDAAREVLKLLHTNQASPQEVSKAHQQLTAADQLITTKLVDLQRSHDALNKPVFSRIVAWFAGKSADERRIDVKKAPPVLKILAQRLTTPDDAVSFETLRRSVSQFINSGELAGCEVKITCEGRLVVKLGDGGLVDMMYCRPGEVRFSWSGGNQYAVTSTTRALQAIQQLANGESVTFRRVEDNHIRKIPTALPMT